MLQRSRRLIRWIAPSSLQARLSLGVALLATFSVGCMSMWMSWQTRQILVGRHIRQVTDVVRQIPQDVQRYRATMPVNNAIQKVSDLRSFSDMSVVVALGDELITRSDRLAQSQNVVDHLMTQMDASSAPSAAIETQIITLDSKDYLVCTGPLQNQLQPYNLYVFLDITEDKARLRALVRRLTLATGLTLLGLVIAVSLYVKRSLRPLRQMSEMTAHLKLEELGHVGMRLEKAPTEVSELVKTCEEMLSRLAAALQQQRQFTHDISHELRTPLAITYGYLQSLQRRSDNLKPPQHEALATAVTETEHSIAILEDLLSLARADSGSIQSCTSEVCVIALVQEIAQKLEASSRREIVVEVPGQTTLGSTEFGQSNSSQPSSGQSASMQGGPSSIPSPPPHSSSQVLVRVDPEKLRQVLVKLIDNALRYSGPEQTVVLRVLRSGNSVIIQVCDRGIGIPLADQPRIFDRCYRVDMTRNRTTGGTGLGLSLVKTLVDDMGGQVSVASEPGRGSTFTVSLPLVGHANETPHRSR